MRSIRDLELRQTVQNSLQTAILNASFDALFACDMDCSILMVNKAAVRIFGYEDEMQLLGKNIKCVVGGGHAELHDGYMAEYKKSGNLSIDIGSMREVWARRMDGSEFVADLGIEVVHDEKGDRVFVAFVRDLTAQKKATQLQVECRASEKLLANVLPCEIVRRLKEDPSCVAEHYNDATILFADIVGFTELCSRTEPVDLLQFVNDLFTRFDHLVDKYEGLNKIKTIGDAYMVSTIPCIKADTENVACTLMCHFALDLLNVVSDVNKERSLTGEVKGPPIDIRVGIHVGPVVAGVVGTSRFQFDIWGDAVNVGSRMESHGEPGKIQVTAAVHDKVAAAYLGDEENPFTWGLRREIPVKGKKGPVTTYFLNGRTREHNHPGSTGFSSLATYASNDTRCESKRLEDVLQDIASSEAPRGPSSMRSQVSM